jgi:FkbM family methyltransferase
MINKIRKKIRQLISTSNNETKPASPALFIIKETMVLCQKILLATHRQDRVLSAMLRGEVALCPYYQAELAWLKDQIKPGDSVLDAGGNIGSVSIALSLAQPDANIYAFEPDPMNFSLFQMNLALNGCRNVSAFNLALGAEEGFIRFFRSPDNFGDHRTAKPKGVDLREVEFQQLSAPIQKVCAYSFLPKCFPGVEIDLAKIDTQGADFEILGSILPLLKTNSKIAIEFSPYHIDSNGTSREQVEQLLSGFSSLIKIRPNAETIYELEETNQNALMNFYDEQKDRYKTHFDLILFK